MTARQNHVCPAREGSFAEGAAIDCRFCAQPDRGARPRDPEAHPLYRIAMAAIALAAMIALGLVGEDVEEHNRQALREYVDAQ